MTKRGSSEPVQLQAPSLGAEMGALCPPWMASHDQFSHRYPRTKQSLSSRRNDQGVKTHQEDFVAQ